MFEQGHSSNRQNERLLLSTFTDKFELAFVLTQEGTFLRVFIFKPTERASVLLKNGTKDFQNRPPFKKSPCFYETITGNFDRFQCCNFETYFLKNENMFEKTGLPLFSWK